MSFWKGGTGLEGNSRGNPVMSHGHMAGQASDQANEGGQAGAGSTGDKSYPRHAKGGQACKESPGATRHQHWPVPAEMPGTDMPRLTGMQEVSGSSPLSSTAAPVEKFEHSVGE